MNPVERQLAHPVNPFVARAAADRELAEAFTFSQVLAVDVARPVGAIKHGFDPPPVMGLVASAFGVLVGLAVVAVAGMAMVGGMS